MIQVCPKYYRLSTGLSQQDDAANGETLYPYPCIRPALRPRKHPRHALEQRHATVAPVVRYRPTRIRHGKPHHQHSHSQYGSIQRHY